MEAAWAGIGSNAPERSLTTGGVLTLSLRQGAHALRFGFDGRYRAIDPVCGGQEHRGRLRVRLRGRLSWPARRGAKVTLGIRAGPSFRTQLGYTGEANVALAFDATERITLGLRTVLYLVGTSTPRRPPVAFSGELRVGYEVHDDLKLSLAFRLRSRIFRGVRRPQARLSVGLSYPFSRR